MNKIKFKNASKEHGNVLLYYIPCKLHVSLITSIYPVIYICMTIKYPQKDINRRYQTAMFPWQQTLLIKTFYCIQADEGINY